MGSSNSVRIVIAFAGLFCAGGAQAQTAGNWNLDWYEDRLCSISSPVEGTETSITFWYKSGEKKFSFNGPELFLYPQKVRFEFDTTAFVMDVPVTMGSISVEASEAFERAFERASTLRVIDSEGKTRLSVLLTKQAPRLKEMQRRCA